MIAQNSTSKWVLEITSSVSTRPAKQDQAEVELMVALGGDPNEIEEVAVVSNEAGRVIVSTITIATGELCSKGLDDVCRQQANALAGALDHADEQQLYEDLSKSLSTKIPKFSRSVVFTVFFIKRKLLSVGATEGFGVENFWWHRGPVDAGKRGRLFRFSAEIPLHADAKSVRDAAKTLGLDSQELFLECVEANRALRSRVAAVA